MCVCVCVCQQAYTKRAPSPPINFAERGTNVQIANCSVYCQYQGRGDTNIRRCGTKNCGNTETDLLDKQRFSSLRTNTRMECVLKWYLDRGFVLGRRFVLRVALQGAVTNKVCVVTFLRETLALCHTVTPSIAALWQPQISHCDKNFRYSQLPFRNWSSSVTTVTSYGLDGPGFETL